MALSDDPALQAALAESRQQAREATASLRQLAAHLSAERSMLITMSMRTISSAPKLDDSAARRPNRSRARRTTSSAASGSACKASAATSRCIKVSLMFLRFQFPDCRSWLFVPAS